MVEFYEKEAAHGDAQNSIRRGAGGRTFPQPRSPEHPQTAYSIQA